MLSDREPIETQNTASRFFRDLRIIMEDPALTDNEVADLSDKQKVAICWASGVKLNVAPDEKLPYMMNWTTVGKCSISKCPATGKFQVHQYIDMTAT